MLDSTYGVQSFKSLSHIHKTRARVLGTYVILLRHKIYRLKSYKDEFATLKSRKVLMPPRRYFAVVVLFGPYWYWQFSLSYTRISLESRVCEHIWCFDGWINFMLVHKSIVPHPLTSIWYYYHNILVGVSSYTTYEDGYKQAVLSGITNDLPRDQN